MSRNEFVRQMHRTLSIIFTLAVALNVVLNVVPLVGEEFVMWVGILTLLPLGLLLATGLYLFVLPYVSGKADRPTDAA